MSNIAKPLLRPMMPELNSLRGLACLAVLLFHGLCWYIPESATGPEAWLRTGTQGGYRGVNLFFVLSGLLITNILLNSKSQPDYFTRFYKRRALRILPAYYMLVALLAVYGVSNAFLGLSVLYLSNMAPMLGVTMSYGPLWSLAVEEQFYLVWPLLVRRFTTRTIVVIAVGLFVNSVLLGFQTHTNAPQATMPIWFAAHGLAIGSLLAVFLRSRLARMRNAISLAATSAAVGFATIAISRHWREPFAGTMQAASWDLIFAATLLFALLVGTSRYQQFVRPKLLLFFGEISYGLYLVHLLVFMVYRRILHPGDSLVPVLAQFVICSAISIAAATISRFTIEEWFLAQKDRQWRLSNLPLTETRKV
jgi:peptidoglycan/LPS O-acetylase OafA/YrhL